MYILSSAATPCKVKIILKISKCVEMICMHAKGRVMKYNRI